MNAQLSIVHALTSLHAGTGQGAGIIDLPIAREKATGIPFLPGSSLKGALSTRYYSGNHDTEKARIIFGPKDLLDAEKIRASMLQFSDQSLLLLPVRSLSGIFAWVTSPYILYRFLRDIADTTITTSPPINFSSPQSPDRCYVASKQSAITLTPTNDPTKQVYLEDLDLVAEHCPVLEEWARWLGKYIFPAKDDPENSYWQEALMARLCLVHDDLFSFLLETATEVTARIRLQEETKTVAEGALWYEEKLPAETILSGVVLALPTQDSKLTPEEVFKELATLAQKTIQLGGNATVGQGFCRVRLIGGE